MRILSKKRIGAILVLVAISLVALVGMLGVVVDGGVLYEERRHAQVAADAAALAAAAHLFNNHSTQNDKATKDGAIKHALEVAKINGYTDGADAKITVNIPPADGVHKDKSGYAEVIITFSQERYFSRIFGDGAMTVSARAVARGIWGPGEGSIIVLDPDDRQAFSITGNGQVQVVDNEGNPAGSIQVDSGHETAAAFVNGNGFVKASELNVHGGLSANNGTVDAKISQGPDNVPRIGDPLSHIGKPSVPAVDGKVTPLNLNKKGSSNELIDALIENGTVTQEMVDNANNFYVLTPGRYPGKLQYQNKDFVILQQALDSGNTPTNGLSGDSIGVYYLESGFKSTSAIIVMDPTTKGGLLLYNATDGNSNKIDIAGNPDGVVDIAGLHLDQIDSTNKGFVNNRFNGLVIFQARDAKQDVSVEGNGFFRMRGTFYAPAAELKLTGNGNQEIFGSQLISNLLTASGNGIVRVIDPDPIKARERTLQLVE